MVRVGERAEAAQLAIFVEVGERADRQRVQKIEPAGISNEAMHDPLEHLHLPAVQLPAGVGDDGDAVRFAEVAGPDPLGGVSLGPT